MIRESLEIMESPTNSEGHHLKSIIIPSIPFLYFFFRRETGFLLW
jgi:hypothetical protein